MKELAILIISSLNRIILKVYCFIFYSRHYRVNIAARSVIIFKRLRVTGRNNIVSIGRNAILKNINLRINGCGNSIVIEDNVRIYEKAKILFEGSDSTLTIRESSTIGSVEIFLIENGMNVSIGKDCMLSREISISTSDFHPILSVNNGERINNSADVFIGNHVWVGNGVLINKGSVISENSIVGARAVVSRGDFKSNSIV